MTFTGKGFTRQEAESIRFALTRWNDAIKYSGTFSRNKVMEYNSITVLFW